MGLLDKAIGSSVVPNLGKKKTLDPLGLKDTFSKSPEKPKKTAHELAIEKRQKMLLNKEIKETESKQKALARSKLGAQSLLSGAARTQTEAATRGGLTGSNSSILGASLSGGSSGTTSASSGSPRSGGGIITRSTK